MTIFPYTICVVEGAKLQKYALPHLNLPLEGRTQRLFSISLSLKGEVWRGQMRGWISHN